MEHHHGEGTPENESKAKSQDLAIVRILFEKGKMNRATLNKQNGFNENSAGRALTHGTDAGYVTKTKMKGEGSSKHSVTYFEPNFNYKNTRKELEAEYYNEIDSLIKDLASNENHSSYLAELVRRRTNNINNKLNRMPAYLKLNLPDDNNNTQFHLDII